MSSNDTQFVQIRVTPEIAVKWLEKNTLNREINQYRVFSYASEMKAGRWRLNGDTIRFAVDGTLLDGQHRLWAVVEAGVPVDFHVVYGIDPSVRSTIDTGRPRSTADFFRMLDGVPNASRVVATIKVIESICTNQRAPMSYEATKERYGRFKEGIEWSFKTFPGGGKIDSTPVRAALAFAYSANKTKVNDFATKLRSGANLTDGDPTLALRNYLLERQPVIKDDPRTVAIKVLSAYYSYFTNTHMVKVYAKDDGLSFFSKFYPDIHRASPAKRLAALPVGGQDDLDIEIRRVPSAIDVPRPWATKKGLAGTKTRV